MTRCRQRLPWNPEWRCDRVGWVFGYCVEHLLEHGRFEHRGDEDRTSWWSLDLSNIHRPYVYVDDRDPPHWISLSWGDHNGDAVWSVQVPLRGAASRLVRRLFPWDRWR